MLTSRLFFITSYLQGPRKQNLNLVLKFLTIHHLCFGPKKINWKITKGTNLAYRQERAWMDVNNTYFLSCSYENSNTQPTMRRINNVHEIFFFINSVLPPWQWTTWRVTWKDNELIGNIKADVLRKTYIICGWIKLFLCICIMVIVCDGFMKANYMLTWIWSNTAFVGMQYKHYVARNIVLPTNKPNNS